uniref:Phosphopantothenoylcysteine decarboxylase-like n=1 Tax=Ciona intestinalis TaxID=7719 RepID=F6V580_CIOIN|nr:phosphopantothenoylcysteine decarboxylase-like [Ciona intestinalis]|eukprot:XP_002130996.1 phosphopantothenoylcysteine decarboxylase-like [Ciona intestinalis]
MVNILIGCTGSVASIKVPLLVEKLKSSKVSNCTLRVVTTENAKHFFEKTSLNVEVYDDNQEWDTWKKRGDPVLHIELRKWADVFIIAPLDANTLAKLSSGVCDNLVTCVARGWPVGEKPFIFCPAMNTMMWQHPVTKMNIDVLESWGYVQVPPVSKLLVCGDEGLGAMCSVDTIVEVTEEIINRDQRT